MDLKPKSLLRYVVRRAKAELVKRVTSELPPTAGPSSPGGPAADVAPASAADAPLVCERRSAELVRARWQVSPAQRARFATLLDGTSHLAVRCAVFHVDASGVARREVLQREHVAASGSAEWGVPEGARCVVSVGLCGGERFLSIAHAEAARQ